MTHPSDIGLDARADDHPDKRADTHATMNAQYTLECNDADADSAMRSWLDSCGLEWQGHVTLQLQVVDTLPPTTDTRDEFPQPGMLIQAGPPDNTVRIRWTGPHAEAVVHASEPSAVIVMTRAAVEKFDVAERAFLLVALLFVLRRLGLYHVHCAAVVDPLDRGWLFVGQSHSGKSTTSALLASNGWSVSTDDIAFLAQGDGRTVLHGFRSPIALREGGQALLGARGGLDFSRRGKMGFHAEDLGGTWVSQVTPSVLVFPTVGESTTLSPMLPRAAMNALIESSLWVLFESTHAQEHLDAMSRLVAQCTCYRATLGPDLFDNPSLLLEMVP